MQNSHIFPQFWIKLIEPFLLNTLNLVYFSICLINPSSKLHHNFALPLKGRSWISVFIPLYFWNNQEHSRECSQYLPPFHFSYFFFSPLGWKVVLVDFFLSWILPGSSIKQCWCLEIFEAWAGNWPASNLSAPPRPVKSSTSPPLSQLTELWDNISFLAFSWPFCSLRKEGDGLF